MVVEDHDHSIAWLYISRELGFHYNIKTLNTLARNVARNVDLPAYNYEPFIDWIESLAPEGAMAAAGGPEPPKQQRGHGKCQRGREKSEVHSPGRSDSNQDHSELLYPQPPPRQQQGSAFPWHLIHHPCWPPRWSYGAPPPSPCGWRHPLEAHHWSPGRLPHHCHALWESEHPGMTSTGPEDDGKSRREDRWRDRYGHLFQHSEDPYAIDRIKEGSAFPTPPREVGLLSHSCGHGDSRP